MSNRVAETVAKTFRKRRNTLGVSEATVAERAQIARGTYSNIETGKRAPTLEQFVRLCAALYLSGSKILEEIEGEL